MRRPRRRIAASTLVVAVLVAAALAAVLRLGAGDRAGDVPPSPPAGVTVPLPAMLPSASCRDLDVRRERAAGRFPDIALLASPQAENDGIEPPQGNAITWLPVRTFDPLEARRAGRILVFPSLGVSVDGRCGADDGPGLCLVDSDHRFRCFTPSQVQDAGALARTSDGTVVGIVPDGIEQVTLTAAGATATAEVVENVYEARLDVPAGAEVHVAPVDSACAPAVAPALLARIAVLRRPAEDGHALPRAARAVLREWEWQLDAVVLDGARFWGGGDGVEFWAVPVVKLGSPDCAPAKHVCIVAAVVEGESRADAQCTLGPVREEEDWRLAPLMPGHAAIYGTVPDGVSGALVTIGKRSAEVDAGDNVIGGRLPFPYEDEAGVRVELIRRPGPPQPAVGADELVRIEARARTPRPVLDTEAPVIVVVGGG